MHGNCLKKERKNLPLVLYSIIYLRSLLPLIMKYLCGRWIIFMGLEFYPTSYLQERQQYIFVRDVGQIPGMQLWVLQGSSLGSLLLASYANDLDAVVLKFFEPTSRCATKSELSLVNIS